MLLRLLKNKAIDKSKWDALVNTYALSPIYNSSALLDVLCPQWQLIVDDDYTCGMVVPFKSKWGLDIIATPPFIQKLECISALLPLEDVMKQVQQLLCSQFKLININTHHCILSAATTSQYLNLILPLNRSYASISEQYAVLCKRKLKKANTYNFQLVQDVDVTAILDNFVSFYASKINYTAHHIHQLLEFCQAHPRSIQTFGVVFDDKLIYSCLCYVDHKRVYYIISAPTPLAVQCNATYWCMDQIIRKYAEQDLILDFEGSNIEDIAFYYTRFGAVKEPYFNQKLNNLPFGIKQLVNYKLRF